MKLITILSAFAVVFACSAAEPKPTAANREKEAALIQVLQSSADRKAKADACRELAIVGGKAAVKPLASLLPDEQLSHMARYALETIPDSSVDKALREAASRRSKANHLLALSAASESDATRRQSRV